MSKNIACNLIYNNGGEGTSVGFSQTCDIDNIVYNVELGTQRWCSQLECACSQYYESDFEKKPKDKFPCNESRLFRDWEWTPGNNFKTGEPFTIKHVGANKLAILTTVFKGDKGRDRKIVGFFKIREVLEDNHRIVAFRRQSIRLPLDEAKELNFWSYYKNKNSDKPDWKQGRFRYMEDENVAAILHDLLEVVQDDKQKSIIKKVLLLDFSEYAFERPDVESVLSKDNVETILRKRKYGKGGESREHKELKRFVLNNPNKIGLRKSKFDGIEEHGFLSGDRVDILFKGNAEVKDVVVEIELDNVMPGLHQAIKYRALRCAELGLPISSKKVKAVVVAWAFNKKEIAFCKQYDISYFKHKL